MSNALPPRDRLLSASVPMPSSRPVFAIVTLLALMVLAGTSMLLSEIRDRTTTETATVSVEPKREESPSLTATATRVAIERTATDAVIANLQQENATLKQKVAKLEEASTAIAQLAVTLELKEADVQARLDRSELIPNAAVLKDCLLRAGAKKTWEALTEEATLYVRISNLKATASADRVAWHHSQFTPFLTQEICSVTKRLYALDLPSTVIESFRQRLSEGI